MYNYDQILSIALLPSDHLHPLAISTILQFCIGELGKTATSHSCEHKVIEQGMKAISVEPTNADCNVTL